MAIYRCETYGETNNNDVPVDSHPSKMAIKFVWRLSHELGIHYLLQNGPQVFDRHAWLYVFTSSLDLERTHSCYFVHIMGQAHKTIHYP